ncbi:hypothetical protein F0U44_05630 [Nocardioides humilatus]|uniref:Uncharacterized protein n=1 Tax=Nocardioides humilatus TaxID=2607660 RepID=A0A5B1LM32_9ACTN|nr:hypothetical protein [Nocardioides humilatus]KAA1421751.1 hypothetical protein F0U44_05630 [Nocardioides humilatus]
MSVVAMGDSPWRILMPQGWASIPTGDGAAKVVERIVLRAVGHPHRDELIKIRIELDRQLRGLVTEARHQGAAYVHTIVDPMHGMPVSGSLVVVEVIGPTDDAILEQVRVVLGQGEGQIEVSTEEVAGYAALRRVRRVLKPVPFDSLSEPVVNIHVDYVVDVGPGNVLMLAFSTMSEDLATEMIALFDAMAGTLTRQPEAADAAKQPGGALSVRTSEG